MPKIIIKFLLYHLDRLQFIIACDISHAVHLMYMMYPIQSILKQLNISIASPDVKYIQYIHISHRTLNQI